MARSQSAALDRKKLMADPIMVTTIVVLITFLTLFILYPLAILLVDSFVGDGSFGFGIFERIFAMPTFTKAITNTLKVGFLVGILSALLGLLFAYVEVYVRVGKFVGGLFKVVSMLPVVSPPFVLSLSMIMLFGKSGIITRFLLGIYDNSVYGFWGIAVVQTLTFFPVCYMMLKGLLKNIDPSLEEAARDMGASRWKVFTSVTLPLVLPGLGLLGGAYYLAVTITEPITAMLVFFVAVVMVILATFLLFIAGSVTLCRTLQGNDRFYYQKKNFVALSSLVYRMKRSGAGLAVICILSTMILVMLGSTAGLYFGAEDVVRTLSAEMSREIAAEARAEFYATYGSPFFLALVLSTVFLLASVLMLYYKQLSEGYEDAARFAVMQRVGMTKRDIRTSVNAQLRMVFLLPLLAAFVHLAFAQPMIWRILRLFGLQNLPLVLGVTACACAVFTVLYCAACRLTSNAYCRIVGEGV